jgi:hypothetical protein
MRPLFMLSLLFILAGCGDSEANEDKIKEIIDALDVASKISAEDKEWLDRNDANIISFKDIDFDGHKELVVVHKARGNRHFPEYKAYNLDDYDLVIHYRMDAVFDPETKTVINQWSSSFCTHGTETYQTINNTLEMVRLEYSDYEPDGYRCILKIFERSSDSGNKSLQDFDDESLRITGERRYGIAGANLELVDTKCLSNKDPEWEWVQC